MRKRYIQADEMVPGDVLITANHQLVEVLSVASTIDGKRIIMHGVNLTDNQCPVHWETHPETCFPARRD